MGYHPHSIVITIPLPRVSIFEIRRGCPIIPRISENLISSKVLPSTNFPIFSSSLLVNFISKFFAFTTAGLLMGCFFTSFSYPSRFPMFLARMEEAYIIGASPPPDSGLVIDAASPISAIFLPAIICARPDTGKTDVKHPTFRKYP